MKSYLSILIVGIFVIFSACKDEKPAPVNTRSTPSATGSTTPINPVNPVSQPTAATNNSGVEHYICPNGHVGNGSGAAGQCSKCGAELTHNQAFHANDGTTISGTSSSPNVATSPLVVNPTGQSQTTQTIQSNIPQTAAPAEPPQNAAGVWHYTCSNGCAGGAGSATACAGCGSTLVHNTAYHN